MNDFITLIEAFAYLMVGIALFLAIIIGTLYLIGIWIETIKERNK